MITAGQIKTPGQGMNDAGDALERIVSGAIPPQRRNVRVKLSPGNNVGVCRQAVQEPRGSALVHANYMSSSYLWLLGVSLISVENEFSPKYIRSWAGALWLRDRRHRIVRQPQFAV